MTQINTAVESTIHPTPIFNASLAVEPIYYTVKQAASIMGFDHGTLHNWISAFERGKKPRLFVTTKRGGRRLILISSFHEYLDGHDKDNSHDAVECQQESRGRGRPRNKSKDQLANHY
jgi:hypothetical protein